MITVFVVVFATFSKRILFSVASFCCSITFSANLAKYASANYCVQGSQNAMNLHYWRTLTSNLYLRMWPHLSRSLQTLAEMKITLNYRRIFILLTGLSILLYMLPILLRKLRGTRPGYFVPFETGCLQEKVEEFKDSIHSFDATLHYDEVESNYFPFTGNGYFALGVSEYSSKLLLRQGRFFETVPYFPMAAIDVQGNGAGLHETAATVMDFRNGIVHLLQSYGETSSRCLQITRKIVAHRRIPNLLLETIDLYNPSFEDIEVKMSLQNRFDDIKEAVVLDGKTKDSEVLAGIVEMKANGGGIQRTMIAIARPKLTDSARIILKSGGRLQRQILTLMSYFSMGDGNTASSTKNKLIEEVQSLYGNLIGQPVDTLVQGHMLVWNALWKSGFAISHSKAANAFNGDKINATAYYALCFEKSIDQEAKSSENQLVLKPLAEAPKNPGHCYAGHNTLQAASLWSNFRSVEEIVRMSNLWRLTLLKQGCSSFLALGAEGFLQAFILSLGGIRYSNYDHLEMWMHPKDLHRNYDFRRIAYGNDVHVNVSVLVGEETENKPVLLVSVDRSDKTFYACDAGCLDPPVPLTKAMQEFPVKLTEPITAILYITSDKQHMEELKHTLHLRNIHESDPHPHHVLAEHKHGHSLGGLPALFWISIALLVAVFHIFLIRIVVNEYFNQDKTYVPVKRPLRYTA